MLRPFYFLHIPKTAGNSLRYWLLDFFGPEEELACYYLEDLENLSLEAIPKHHLFCGHLGFELYRFLPSTPHTTTWLREPLAREVSQYKYVLQKKDIYLDIVGYPPSVEYIQAVNRLSLPELCQSETYLGYYDNLQVRYLSGAAPGTVAFSEATANHDIEIQDPSESLGYSLWTRAPKQNCDEAMLEAAKKNLLSCFHFGICEWMNASIGLLCYQLALPPHPLKSRLNEGTTPANLLDLSESDIELIKDINQYDIALYNFAQAEFERRFQELIAPHLSEKPIYFNRSSQSTIPPFAQHGGAHSASRVFSQAKTDTFFEDAISTLLKKHFQAQRQNEKCVEQLSFKVSEPIFLSGWYPRQYYEPLQTWLRWAGPETTSTIYLPLQSGKDYRITFNVLFCMSFDILNSLHLQVRDALISLERISIEVGRSGHLFTGIIPATLIRDDETYTEILFIASQVVFHDPTQNGSHVRYISFAIDGITVESVTKVPKPIDLVLKACAVRHSSQINHWNFQIQSDNCDRPLQHQQAEIQSKISHFSPHDLQLDQLQSKLGRAQSALSKKSHLNKRQRARLRRMKSRLNALRNEIETMRSSKFWQAKMLWTRFKRLFGIH